MLPRAQEIVKREAEIAGHPGIKVVIYGPDSARSHRESLSQGFYISVNGVHTPRKSMATEPRAAVESYLRQHHPEHAQLMGH